MANREMSVESPGRLRSSGSGGAFFSARLQSEYAVMRGHNTRAIERALGGAAPWWRAAMHTVLDRRGGIAIEFALVAPVLLIILLGIIQFGYAFFVQISMTNAAREGARQLAVRAAVIGTAAADDSCPATAGTAQAVTCSRLPNTSSLNFELAAFCNTALCPIGSEVTVRVTIDRDEIALADILGLFGSGEMEAQVTMRQE